MRSLMRIALFILPCLSLSACFIANSSEAKKATCNELRSQIIFSGATSDTRRADIQRAEQPFTQYSYDINCSK